MPVRINLLAETLAAEDLRRRDPVKRAVYLGVLLVLASLVWWSSTLLESMMQKNAASQGQAKIQTLTNEYSQVQINLKKLSEAKKRLDALDQLAADRFLQGNLLNALQQIYVPNVQLMRLRLDQTYVMNDGVPFKTNSFGTVTGGRLPTATERVLLTLDAKDFSPSPGDQVNKFKSAVTQLEYFKSSLDTTNGVRLSSLSPPQSSLDGKPYVLFTLEYRFLDKTR
jgi:hypothetical protein